MDQYSSNQSITLLDSSIYPIVINWLQLDRSVLLIDYYHIDWLYYSQLTILLV